LMGCLLHHVNFPDTALREIRRVVKTDGLVSITLPCDPGLLYRIGKKIGPYRTLKKKEPKINPEYFHYLQHRNHYPALRSQIFEVFKNDEINERAFPFNTRFWNSNLFSVFQIRINKCR
jgi:phosphatidylethanolamine/phosphatidyl-N-methylethanolamine N-methyltransferase